MILTQNVLKESRQMTSGGTELTNDRLWRWDPVHRKLIAP
jgi:hypothetical protein